MHRSKKSMFTATGLSFESNEMLPVVADDVRYATNASLKFEHT